MCRFWIWAAIILSSKVKGYHRGVNQDRDDTSLLCRKQSPFENQFLYCEAPQVGRIDANTTAAWFCILTSSIFG